ncbi:MAG: hypothetical protein QME58_06205 [Bacteroidota bacterium]|nr:hypothetical protein [Bacteroidota bacterium]
MLLSNNDLPSMVFNKGGKTHNPLFIEQVNGKFIIAVYQGSLSKYDILIKYRQRENRKWSYIRTPKHIHWAVDILIKMHSNKESTKRFLKFLLKTWGKIKPLKSRKVRKKILSIENLLGKNVKEISKYKELGKKGEYSIKFLILLAKLLMIQEKTNMERAYFFNDLLTALYEGKDIFKIVSIATHNRI